MTRALIFDSGIGGLSVVAHIRRLMPHLSITYVADDEFRPYGNKTQGQLRARLPGLLRTLEIATQPDIIVIACNTASTAALRAIRAAVNVPVIGVVPAIKPAAEQSKTKVIAVLGTPGTVKQAYVDDLIERFASDCRVVLQGSTRLVNLAEQKFEGRAISCADIREQIAPIFEGQAGGAVDAIVLACTHFPMLATELAAAAPKDVTWIDSGAAIARRVQFLLKDHAKESPLDRVDTALLIGPDACQARKTGFAKHGFSQVVALK